METIETVIVGGGQAGLAVSYYLKQFGREHILYEAADKPAHAWRTDRWDSFCLVTPNWSVQLPGAHYDGPDPDGFMPKDEIVAYFERYVRRFNFPIQFNTKVLEVAALENGGGYRVRSEGGEVRAKNVVMASGSFQTPKIPAFSAQLPKGVHQLHSGQYRNPHQLPDGAVLIVGAAQSGMQIAEELHQAGRVVHLASGAAARIPRRYRGRDIVAWFVDTGFFDQAVDTLPSPKARLLGNPQASGRNGGHDLNLHQFARDGIRLYGRLHGARDGRVFFAPDLKENLAKTDRIETDLIAMIDQYIERNAIDAPRETLPNLQDGYAVASIDSLDLQAEHIQTVIWAMGYTADYNLIQFPVSDADGFPLQHGGASDHPGLYFVGTHWLTKRKSAILFGVSEDAEYVAGRIAKK